MQILYLALCVLIFNLPQPFLWFCKSLFSIFKNTWYSLSFHVSVRSLFQVFWPFHPGKDAEYLCSIVFFPFFLWGVGGYLSHIILGCACTFSCVVFPDSCILLKYLWQIFWKTAFWENSFFSKVIKHVFLI